MLNPVIDSALCASLEQMINPILRQDPGALTALKPLQGKSVQVQCDDWLQLTVRILDESITVSLQAQDNDAVIRGTLTQLTEVALASDKADALMNGQVDISGSSSLVMELAHIAQHLDLDWEALLEPAVGGIVAHTLGKGMRLLFNWGRTTSQTFKTAGKEYLEDEAELLLPKPLMEGFHDDVSELRLSVDRIEAKLNLLKQRLAKD